MKFKNSRRLQHGILLIVFMPFFAINAYCQDIMEDDTLRIPEVVITRKQISSEQPGFKFYSIDSSRLRTYGNYMLNDILRTETPLFIKEYGAGLTSTASFRGTSAGHTRIAWNGININDPMLGQTDFSLIPAAMIDNIMVSFGGASMDLGSGAIGGIINLSTEPVWKKETVIDLEPGIGSFGRYSVSAKISTGSERFQSVTRAYYNQATNNFRYLDSQPEEPAWKTREHNSTDQRNLMQEFYFRKSKDVFSARFWFQETNRNLPGSILYGYSGEKQSDQSLRSVISYDTQRNRIEFSSSAAWMMTNMHYKSYWDTAGSVNKVNTLVIKGGLNYKLDDATTVKVVLNDELSMVESNYYSSQVKNNNASLTISAERKKGKWLGAALLIRETLNDKKFLIPDFSAGLELRTVRGEEHYLKFNVSRNSRIPSLNDRFWNPGGNPDLKNEYAYSLEAGYKLSHTMKSGFSLSSELNYFNNYIRNLIQWYPETEYIWVAGNIGSVNTSGIEAMAAFNYSIKRFNASWNTAYSYTNAVDMSDGSNGLKLIYIPEHQVNSAINISFDDFYTTWTTHFTDRVYTIADNTGYLKGYSINSLSGGYKLKYGHGWADLRIKIDNILNTRYQTIEWYPQPGRTWMILLSLRFKE